MSFAAAKCYDLEAWAPVTQKWFEVSSCSLFTDFQPADEYPLPNSATKKLSSAHTQRLRTGARKIVLCLLENFQQAGGRIVFPKALQAHLS